MSSEKGGARFWIALLVGVVAIVTMGFVAYNVGLDRGEALREELQTRLNLMTADNEQLKEQFREKCEEAAVIVDELPSGTPEPASGKLLPFNINFSLGQEVPVSTTGLTIALKDIARDGESLFALVEFTKPGFSKEVLIREGETKDLDGISIEAIEITQSQARLRVVAAV